MVGAILSWIMSVLQTNWTLVVGVFGALALYVKGRQDYKDKIKRKNLEDNLKASERLRHVETNDNRDDALERLSRGGHVRKDE